jgi:hypothetical protein
MDVFFDALANQWWVLMHQIEKICCPLDEDNNDVQKAMISTSKLDKDSAAWQQLKQALGWDYATWSKNILMALHWKQQIYNNLMEAIG